MGASIVEHGTLYIDTYAEHAGDKALINGHYYSEKAPLPALLVVPFWWALRPALGSDALPEGTLDPNLIRLGGFLIGSIPFALIISCVWLALRRQGGRSHLPLAVAACLPFFGSFLFIQSGAFFGHLIGAAFLLMAFRAWERERLVLCGTLAGCAVLCEYTNAVFPLFWGLLLLFRRAYRPLGSLALGALPSVVFLAAYNMVIAGTPFTISYTHQVGYDYMHTAAGFGWPNLHHLWHITLSDYRGLFFYTPVLILAVVALFVKRDAAAWWNAPVILPALLTIVMMSGFGGWWAGWSYGPRYLTTVAALLLYRCMPAVLRWEQARPAFLVLAAFGLLGSFAAKDTLGFSLPTEFMHPLIEVILPAIGKSHADNQWLILFGVPARICSLLFVALFAAGLLVLRWLDARAASSDPS